MLGPHQSPFIFAWINSVNSITRNYGNKFILILKHFFKIMEVMKIACHKKNCGKFYWKMDFQNLRKMLKMKNGRFKIILKN